MFHQKCSPQSSLHGSAVTNSTRIHKHASLIPTLLRVLKDQVLLQAMVQSQRGSYPVIAAAVAQARTVALFQLLAWKLPSLLASLSFIKKKKIFLSPSLFYIFPSLSFSLSISFHFISISSLPFLSFAPISSALLPSLHLQFPLFSTPQSSFSFTLNI